MNLLIALIGSSMASEPRNEVSVEFGTSSGYASQKWETVGTAPLGTLGISGGYGVSPLLTIIGSAHFGVVVTDHSQYSYDYYYEESPEDVSVGHGNSPLKSRLSYGQLAAGAKFSQEVQPYLVPYSTVQAFAGRGSLTFSDDLDDDQSLIELNDSGLAFGALLSAGAEFRTVPVNGQYNLAAYLEFGYAISTSMDFAVSAGESTAEIGQLGFSGLSVKGGVGIRF